MVRRDGGVHPGRTDTAGPRTQSRGPWLPPAFSGGSHDVAEPRVAYREKELKEAWSPTYVP